MSGWKNVIRLVDDEGKTLSWYAIKTVAARPAELLADPAGKVFELVVLSRTGFWWIYKPTRFTIEDVGQVGEIPQLKSRHLTVRPQKSSDEKAHLDAVVPDEQKPKSDWWKT